MCAAAISFARIRRLYYGAADPKGGGVEHGARIFNHPTCHHAPEIYPGIDEERAATVLRLSSRVGARRQRDTAARRRESAPARGRDSVNRKGAAAARLRHQCQVFIACSAETLRHTLPCSTWSIWSKPR